MTTATCPQCAARYRLSEAQTAGRASVRIRCTRCQTVFTAPVGAEAPAPPAPAAEAGVKPPWAGGPTIPPPRPPGSPRDPALPASGPAPPTATARTVPNPAIPPRDSNVESGFSALFGDPPRAPAAPADAPADPFGGTAAIPAGDPFGAQAARRALDELGAMDSAAPFLDQAFADPPARGPGPGNAPTDRVQAPAPPLPPAAPRSPLEEMSGFAGLMGGPVPAPAPPRGRPEDIDDPFASMRGPSPGAPPRSAAGGPPPGRPQAPPGQDLPSGGQGSAGRKETFYPMLEFSKEFGGLGDSRPGATSQGSPDDSLPPAARPAEPAPAPPRTQAMSAAAVDLFGEAPPAPRAPHPQVAPAVQAPAPAPRPPAPDDALDAALRGSPRTQAMAGVGADSPRLAVDVVGDPNRRSQPRTPYDSAVGASLAVFFALTWLVVGAAAWKNGGTIDFRHPDGMIRALLSQAPPAAPAPRTGPAVTPGPVEVDPVQGDFSAWLAFSELTVVRWPHPEGPLLALVEGTLTHRGDRPLRAIVVEGELRDTDGTPRQARRVHAGRVVQPPELARMRSADAWVDWSRGVEEAVAEVVLAPGQATRFGLVFWPDGDAPDSLAGLVPVVRIHSALVQEAQPAWAPLVAAPRAADAPADAPPADADTPLPPVPEAAEGSTSPDPAQP